MRIGEEVGLEPRYVRRALAEVHADSLLPALPEEARLSARLWGSGIVRAIRVVPLEASEAQARVETYLRDREAMSRVRTGTGRSLWEPAGGLWSTMRRAMNVGGHGYELAKARSLELRVEPLEAGFSLVTLTADLRNERGKIAAGWHFGLAGSGLGAAIALLAVFGPEAAALLGAGAIGGTAAAGASWATAAQYRRRRERLELVLQGLLDRLEQGEPLVSSRPGWRERLLDAAP